MVKDTVVGLLGEKVCDRCIVVGNNVDNIM